MRVSRTILLCICTLISMFAQAQTYYYRLQSYGKTGIETKRVSGGQFITFQAAICMETDKTGTSIGSGYLQRKYDNPNLYIGSAYWGNGTKFLFSSDKRTLKVTTPNGLIYQYIKAIPPNGVATCSLIRKASSGIGGGYIPTTIPRNPTTHSCGVCHGTGKCSTCNGNGYNMQTKYTCGACNGTGLCTTCGGDGIYGN